MIILYIFLSFAQVLLLPGLLFCAYKKSFNFFKIISISIISNYLIIILISNFSFDKKIFLLILIIFEVILISYYLKNINKVYLINFTLDNYKTINLVLISFIFYFLFLIFGKQYATLFEEGDVLLSWNEWSYNLLGSTYTPDYLEKNNFENAFKTAQSRSYYGQLIPASWSIFYALTNMTDLTMYPKFLNFLFSFLAIIYLVKNYILEDNQLYILILLLITYFFFKEHAILVYSGMVDASFSIFIFLSLAHIVNFEKKFDEDKIIISILFASIASNIKLLGCFYSIIFLPIYIIYNYKIPRKKLFFYLCLLLITSLFWPIYQFLFYNNNIFSNNNLEYLNSLSVNSIESGIDRIRNLFNNKIDFIFFSLMLFISCFNKKTNFISIFLVIPYLVIWYNFSSYDVRNILVIIPILCLLSSFIILKLFKKIKIFKKKIFFTKKVIFSQQLINKLILLTMILIIPIFLLFNEQYEKKLIQGISDKKKLIKNEELNLYLINNLNNIDVIITDYIYLRYVLNKHEKSLIYICDMYQKENIQHCLLEKINNIILVTYYGDELKKKN